VLGTLACRHGLGSRALTPAHRRRPSPWQAVTFALEDNAVATMKWVGFGVSPGLSIHDLAHAITP